MESLKCKIYTNSKCLNCKKVEEEMILIGAFIMCKDCWSKFFGATEIDLNSDSYKITYKQWLKKYKKL